MARPQEFDRANVLNQAMSVFWEKGYKATSLVDLLKITGLSKSSLYGSFGDKHQLFLEAFDLYRLQRLSDMRRILESSPTRESIEDFFKMIIRDASQDSYFNGCMSINQAVELAPSDNEVKVRISEDFKVFEAVLFEAIQKGQKEGSIRNTRSPDLLAKLLFIAFPGLQVLVRSGQDSKTVSTMLEVLLSNLD